MDMASWTTWEKVVSTPNTFSSISGAGNPHKNRIFCRGTCKWPKEHTLYVCIPATDTWSQHYRLGHVGHIGHISCSPAADGKWTTTGTFCIFLRQPIDLDSGSFGSHMVTTGFITVLVRIHYYLLRHFSTNMFIAQTRQSGYYVYYMVFGLNPIL